MNGSNRHLSLGIPVIDCIEEAVGPKSIAKLRRELCTPIWGACFGQVDDREISEVHWVRDTSMRHREH